MKANIDYATYNSSYNISYKGHYISGCSDKNGEHIEACFYINDRFVRKSVKSIHAAKLAITRHTKKGMQP